MEVRFTKLSDERHRLAVTRDSGSTERVEVASKDFLNHDLAHFAVEVELGADGGFWGWVAAGGSLDGEGIDNDEIMMIEALAGPVQALVRTEAEPAADLAVLLSAVPERASAELAQRIWERVRRLRGHWRATAYGEDMVLTWPADSLID